MGWSGNPGMNDLLYYYSYPFMPFLYLAAILGLARLTRWSGRLGRHRTMARVGLTLLLTVAGAWMICGPTRTENKLRLPAQSTQRQTSIRLALREIVPPDASVAAQFDLLCQLPMRLGALPLSERNIKRADYLVLDLKGFPGDVAGEAYRRILEQIAEWIKEGRAKQLLFQDGLLIVRRTPDEPTDSP
jgi:Predicted membrane protein (DUF2079)